MRIVGQGRRSRTCGPGIVPVPAPRDDPVDPRGRPMNLEPSDRGKALQETLLAFMDSHVYPAEP
ncbi:MAG TPA: hypothetical protein PLX07_12060, partial [Microthrixaceae bacterium]|nr:hypothetical protein [Microthrixaceae bacterium]